MSVKYSKFDSFLKRILPNKEYKEVRTYEPCVVISNRDKHAFRFVFLTNHEIYVTENPPKTLLYSIHLKDVVDIFMVNDKANFLQADLRDRVQHVIVKHTSVNDDGTPEKVGINKDLSLTSPQHSFPTPEEQASSSKDVSPPLLCSYANVSTIDSMHRHSLGSDEASGSETEDPISPRLWGLIKTATGWKSKTKLDKAEAMSRWEQKDPYPIQVFLPDCEDGLSHDFKELHLYILDSNTKFLPLLKSLWRNYIVNSTFHFPDFEKMSPEKSASMDENTRTLFADLKQELMHVRSVEQLYGLYNELKTAAAQDILIKSLFWKDDVLLRRSLELIGRYVVESVSVDIDERADEIELTNIILQTLGVMLRETEAIPQCYRVLQNFSLPFFTNTVNVLLSSPRLLCDSWSYNVDIKSMLMEFTIAVCEVLYQLIICSQQITWTIDGKSPIFNSSSLFTAFDRNEYLHTFLDRLIRSCINIWDPREKSTKLGRHVSAGVKPFDPEDAVKAFFLFTVFHRIISKCPTAAHYVKFSYQEEFKYYINAGSVPLKFPAEYPIAAMARSAVHAVGYFITGMRAHAK